MAPRIGHRQHEQLCCGVCNWIVTQVSAVGIECVRRYERCGVLHTQSATKKPKFGMRLSAQATKQTTNRASKTNADRSMSMHTSRLHTKNKRNMN